MKCDACIIGPDDYDAAEFYAVTLPVARTQHACCECTQPILPGQAYERVVGKFEGRIETYRTCQFCREIRTVFICEGGWIYGDLWHEMEEQSFPRLTTASSCFTELSPKAKAFVLDRWRTWKGLTPP